MIIATWVALSCGATPQVSDPPRTSSAPGAATPSSSAGVASAPDVVRDEVGAADRAAIEALSARATHVLSAFSNGSPILSRDGKTLAYRSNRDGTLTLYAASTSDPKAPPRRLVASDERIAFVGRVPGTDTLIWTSDRGADERFRIFAGALDGSPTRALTPEADELRDEPRFAARVPQYVYFSTRPTQSSTTTVARVKVDGNGAVEPLGEVPSVGTLKAVTADGKVGLFMAIDSLSSQRVLAIDLLGKASPRTLFPASGQAAVHAIAALDAQHCLVATDDGGEKNAVLVLDVATGRQDGRIEEPRTTGAIGQIAVAEDGKTVALLVDVGSHQVVELHETKSWRRLPTPQLPLGDGSFGAFSADGRRLLVRWATPESPGDLFSVEVHSGRVSSLRADVRPELATLPVLDVSILRVPAHDGLLIPVNVYVPKSPTGKKPVIVMVHGGPADSSAVGYSPFVRFYTSVGFAVVEPNIRGSTGFGRAYEQADDGPKRLDGLTDLGSVATWLKGQPWADGERLVVWGGSYGGYMTLMGMTRQSDVWRAGVDLVGPSSWRSFMATTTGMIRTVFAKEIGSVEHDGAFLDSISPLRDVDRIQRPLFVFQGVNDPRVPKPESDAIVASLRKRGVPVEYMVADDEGHSLDRRPNQVAFLARTTHFLQKHLGIVAAQ